MVTKVKQNEPARVLLDFWMLKYRKRFKVEYELDPLPVVLDQCETILTTFGEDVARAKRAMHVLLFKSELSWVKQVNLRWLSKPANASFIVPHIDRRRTGAEASTRGDDTEPTSAVVRRGRTGGNTP